MREGQFIKQNKDRWRNYEVPTDDPDELAKQFTNLVDDLSYAKTFYPHGNTTKYLNSLGSNIYLSIYKNRKEKRNRLITFWTEEIPLIVQRNHKTLLFSLLFFAAFVAIGVFSAKYDQNFVRSILGDSYVDMTERNIAKGDAFGVYKQQSQLPMFISIASNNIAVAFRCFLMGLVCSVGTIWFLLKNGLMLGVFEYIFFSKGIGFNSIMVVFIHGTLEISALVIAGCAGMVLGNSILFPGTFTRLQSIQRGAKDGVKIMISLIPVFIVAAFFEGFVTRHTEMPKWMSMLILISSLAFILYYYVYLPITVSKRLSIEDDALA